MKLPYPIKLNLPLLIKASFQVLFLFIRLNPTAGQERTQQKTENSKTVEEYFQKINQFFFTDPDSTIFYCAQLEAYARSKNDQPLLIRSMQIAGEGYRAKGDFPRSLNTHIESYWISRKENLPFLEAMSASFIGFTHLQAGFYREALNYIIPATAHLDTSWDKIHAGFNNSNAAQCYTSLGMLDSANYFNSRSLEFLKKGVKTDFRANALLTLILDRLGNYYQKKGDLQTALLYYRDCLAYARKYNIMANQKGARKNIAKIHYEKNNIDSALFHARLALSQGKQNRFELFNIEAAEILTAIYTLKGEKDSILYYQSILLNASNKVYGREKFGELQYLITQEQLRHQQDQLEGIAERNQQRLLMVGALAIALGGIALILRRNNNIKQNLNIKLNAQKHDLEQALQKLRNTQTQLIQAEKMASLGELTAGIAHEIQNPLNFVNNFSDINAELAGELKEALGKGDLEEVRALAEDIISNQGKISEHGKRADSIVKNMLQHSRTSSGTKEPTDLNKLADEYLRLAYHGFRAKDKSFNTNIRTNLDPNLPSIPVVPQDLGRVLLNLFNNALYAVNERKKTSGEGYEPEISLSSEINNGKVILTVTDNGPGIPAQIREKIFQPFFTTKPTGEGTGLGLSLSYDIVKAHGGEIKLEINPKGGTSFIVQLPEKPGNP